MEHFKKRRLNVLIDSGSTHILLNLVVAKQVGCPSQKTMEQKVLVAHGDIMDCNSMVKGFVWTMKDKRFKAIVLLMPLRGYELILGI